MSVLVMSAEGRSEVAPSAVVAGVTSAVAPPVTGSFGDLDSPVWTSALHANAFRNFTTRGRASDPTDAYLVFGPDAVYCAFVSTQGEPITATQTANGVGLGLDDYVTLMFDTSGNGTNDYFFDTTPLGTRYQQALESSRYDPAWTARSAIGTGRWLAELVVPYRFLRGVSNVWRVNFSRYVASERTLSTWAYEPAMTLVFDQFSWPRVKGSPSLAARRPPATAQVYALASAGRDRRVFEGGAGQFTATQTRVAGIDAKVPLTSGLDLDATLDPDFSNLESDQQIVQPQEFAYQYGEYRPFFTQGANDLPTSEIFYSPSIGVFTRGEKLEGQVSNYAIGLLDVGSAGRSDQAYAFTYDDPDRELAVSSSGARAGRPGGSDEANELAFIDTVLSSKVQYGAGFARESGSFALDPSEAERSYLFGGITKPNYSAQAAYFDIGPDYHPLDAYVGVSDIRGPVVNASLNSTTSATDAIRQGSLYGFVDRYVDRSGAVREADTDVSGTLLFKDLLAVTISQYLSSLRAYAEPYPAYTGALTTAYDQNTVAASFRSGSPDSAIVSYEWGPYGGHDQQQVTGSITHQFSRRYHAEFDYADVIAHGAGAANGQVLRRLTLVGTLSADESVTAAYRTISGTGGFAQPGHNLAISYARRFGKGDTLQIEFGSPAASRTLGRFIVKYVLLVGSGAGE